jgi:hypothetical protein
VSDEVAPSEVEWCEGVFRMLKDGGTWGVPRSGLIFQRQGESFHLISKMPFMDGMPGTPEDLAEYQADDFAAIKARFDRAGIKMDDRT